MNLRKQQEKQLLSLLSAAAETNFGQTNKLDRINSYEDFRDELPLSFYSDITEKIEQLKQGASDVLWPGKIHKFAVSAGTSGSGKHLPLSPQRLDSDRRFMRKVTWSYLLQRPNFFRLLGKHISLPGIMEKKDDYQIGEISAFSAQQAPALLIPFQLISPNELLQLSFSKKINRIINEAIHEDIRVITAVPSWLLTIFQRILERTQANSIGEVWPNLQLLVCGGVKLANYQPHLEQLLGKTDVDFIETYGASEGYFSFSDNLQKDDMKLVIDNGIFYEFIPHPSPNEDSLSNQETVPLWEVEPDIPYAMLVTSNAGLWRYALNDIVTFTHTNPPRIKVLGRVSEMLDDYGEALYAYEAEQALEEAVSEHAVKIDTFTVGASMEEEYAIPRHVWFLLAPKPIHQDSLDRLSSTLDAILQEKNRHYAIRRESGALATPELHTITQENINHWLQQKGKNKAQGKFPAILRNDSDIRFFKSV